MKNRGLAVVVVGLGLLAFARAKGGASSGEAVVTGGVGSVSLGTHRVLKAPNGTVTVTIPYTVSAFKNNVAVPWDYKLFVSLAHRIMPGNFHVEAAPALDRLANGSYTATVTLTMPSELGVYDLAVVLGAKPSVGGVPSGTLYDAVASASHLEAVQVVPPEAVTSGSLGVIGVSQGADFGLAAIFDLTRRRRWSPSLPNAQMRPGDWTYRPAGGEPGRVTAGSNLLDFFGG